MEQGRGGFAQFYEAASLRSSSDPALRAYYDGDLQQLGRILSENVDYVTGAAASVRVPFCHLAATDNRPDVLQLLYDLGPGLRHLQHPDTAGKNCLHTAIRHSALEATALLLERGFDPNEPDSEGQTPLHAASIVDDDRLVTALLGAGADCNRPDHNGNLPVHHACQENQLAVVRLLLPRTTDINVPGAYGRTALHYAAMAQSLPLIKFLLRRRAAIRVYDNDCQTPMDIVLSMGNQNLMAGLSRHFGDMVAADCDNLEELMQNQQFKQVLEILDAIDDDLENPLDNPLATLNLPIGEVSEEECDRIVRRIAASERVDFIDFRKMVFAIAKEDLSPRIVEAGCVQHFASLVSKHVLFKEDADMLNIIMFGTTLWPQIQVTLENDIQTMYEGCSEMGSTGMVSLMHHTFFEKDTKMWSESLMRRFFHGRLRMPYLSECDERDSKFMRNPVKTLTLWSVVSGRFNLTEDLVKGEQFDILPIGLFCVCLLRKLNGLKEIPRPTKRIMEQVADRVESVCIKLIRDINVLDTTEKKMVSINFLRQRLPLYSDFTCMGLASIGQSESFMVMPSTQAAVDREWYKRLYHSSTMFRELLILLGLIPFNPLLFFLLRKQWIATSHLDSSNPEELAHLDRLEIYETEKDDDEEEQLTDEKEEAEMAEFQRAADAAPPQPPRSESVWHDGSKDTGKNPVLDFLWLYTRTLFAFYFTPAVKFHYHILAHVIFIGTFSYIVVAHFQYHISHAEILLYLFLLGFLLEELHEMNDARENGALLNYFSDGWNMLDNTGLLLSFVGFCMRLAMVRKVSTDTIDHYGFTDMYYFWTRFVLQMACLVYWMRLLYVSTVMETLGPKLKMISVMITRDFVPFLIMLAIMLFGFGCMMYGLMYPNGYYFTNPDPQSASDIFLGFFRMTFYAMVGDYSKDDITGSGCEDSRSCPHPLSVLFVPNIIMVIYIIIVSVLLLNLIVASFSKTVDEIDKKSFAMWQFERYDLLTELMVRSPLPPPLSIVGEIIRYLLVLWELIRGTEVVLRRRSFSKNRIIHFLTLQAFMLRGKRMHLVGEVEVDDPEKLIPQMARRLKRLQAKLSTVKARIGVEEDD